MAYKQKGFPTHINTMPKSPTEQWEWYEENVKDQGYLAAGASGAQIGAQAGPWGAAFGFVAGVGAKAISNNMENGGSSDGMENMADNTGAGATSYGRQQNRFKELQEERRLKKIEDDKNRWVEMGEANKVKKLEKNYSQTLDPAKMARAMRKLQTQGGSGTGSINEETTTYIPEDKKPYIPPSPEASSTSAVSQLATNNNANPNINQSSIINPFSTNQSALNGTDPTNLAVKYAQFNNISKDLVSDSPINQKSEYYKQMDPLWREKAHAREKEQKDTWEAKHGEVYREQAQDRLKRRGGKKRWEMSAEEVKKEKEDIKTEKTTAAASKDTSKTSKPKEKSAIDIFNADIDPIIESGRNSSKSTQTKKPKVTQEQKEQQDYLDSIESTEEVKSRSSNIAFTPWKAYQSNTKNYLNEFTQTYT